VGLLELANAPALLRRRYGEHLLKSAKTPPQASPGYGRLILAGIPAAFSVALLGHRSPFRDTVAAARP
jgi:hypothetical protein